MFKLRFKFNDQSVVNIKAKKKSGKTNFVSQSVVQTPIPIIKNARSKSLSNLNRPDVVHRDGNYPTYKRKKKVSFHGI